MRRIAALIVLGVLVVSAGWMPRRECAQQVVADESGKDATLVKVNKTLDTCHDASATGLFAVGTFVLTAVLLSRDFSKISFAGVTLEREVKKQAEKLEKQEEKQEKLQNLLLTMQVNMNQSVTNNFVVAGEVVRAERRLPHRRAAVTTATFASVPPLDESAKKLRLIELTELLRELETRVRFREARLPEQWTPEDAIGALSVVRRARNSVAHGQPITPEDLDSAVRLAEELSTFA